MGKKHFLQAFKGSLMTAGTAGTAAILSGYAEDKVEFLGKHRWVLPTTALAGGTFLHSKGKAEAIANGLIGYGGVYLLLQAYATLQKKEQTRTFPPLVQTTGVGDSEGYGDAGDDLGAFEDGTTGALVGAWDTGALLPAEGWGDAGDSEGYAEGYGDAGALVGSADNAEGIEQYY